MKIHLLTVGEPKLDYAKTGWDFYLKRLQAYQAVRTTHLRDKWANDAEHILQSAGNGYKVALAIEGEQFSSPQLATFLGQRALDGGETCFIVGGPEGLPAEVLRQADKQWSLSYLTFPHDMAMVVLAEALYRASSINAGSPYHK